MGTACRSLINSQGVHIESGQDPVQEAKQFLTSELKIYNLSNILLFYLELDNASSKEWIAKTHDAINQYYVQKAK